MGESICTELQLCSLCSKPGSYLFPLVGRTAKIKDNKEQPAQLEAKKNLNSMECLASVSVINK